MNAIEEIFGAVMAEPAQEKAQTVEGQFGSVTISPDSRVDVIPTTFPMSRLADRVMRNWRTNVDARRNSGIDMKLRDALLAQTCTYTNEQKEKLRLAGISEKIYSPITNTKVRAAKAMLMDIFNASGEYPFSLHPTANPDLPKEVEDEAYEDIKVELSKIFMPLMQQNAVLPPEAEAVLNGVVAKAVSSRYDEIQHRKEEFARTRAKRMEKRVQDYFDEGGFVDAFQEYVDYICTYGTGLIIGPVPKVKAVNVCKSVKGVPKFTRELRRIPCYEAVNPQDCYPAPDAKDVTDGALCIRIRYSANELQQYVTNAEDKRHNADKAEGWMWHTVRALLDRYPNGGCKIDMEPYDPIRRLAENHGTDDPKDCMMEGVRCFDSVRGSELIDFGVKKNRDGNKIEWSKFYQVETIVIAGFVVYCRIIDDRMGRPVVKGVFYELPGSWWGESVASKLSLVQSVMNNSIKALMTNMAAASGPMYWMNDVSRYLDKDGTGLKIRPHKMWPFQASMMGGGQGAPMGIIQVPSNAAELLAVWEKMKTQADDDSGIPAYTYGQASGNSGAMRTAQGLAIFTEAASRGMKMVIGTTDRLVTRRLVKMTADYILLYDDDLDIKGDCEVVPAGVMGKILRAQQDQQRLQLLDKVINNQFLLQMCGPKGIMALLRPSIQDVAINPDDVLPSEERVKELEKIQFVQLLAAAQQQQMEAQNARAEAEGAAAEATVGDQPKPGSVAERRGAA